MTNEIREFKTAAKTGTGPVRFRIDGEDFYAAAVIPADVWGDLAQFAATQDSKARVEAIGSFMDSVLLPESRDRLAERMKSTEEPMSLDEVADVLTYLVQEVYGKRPTGPSSASPAT